jgi:3-oxoacyl-(acyl-carrier-protein) synthase
MRRVVISGVGVVSPVGIGKEEFWHNLLKGTSGEVAVEQITSSALFQNIQFEGIHAFCEASDFDPARHYVPPAYHQADRITQFAFSATEQAIRDARLDPANDTWRPERTGISLGTAIGGIKLLEEEFVRVTNQGQEPLRNDDLSPALYSAAMHNSIPLALSAHYGVQGECTIISTGCIGGLDAISYAYESIASGEHDLMLTGATEAPIAPITVAAFDIINCLSHFPEPGGASRPFSLGRDGFVLSEGCGMVVLEELEHALARNAPIYAEILGYDVTEHAMHLTDMSPEGRDLARAIDGALTHACAQPADIHFVNAHGTSTPQNDYFETLALKSSLGEHASLIPINSSKSMLGHSLAASSAIEIVGCVMSLHTQRLHPTINLVTPDPECDLDYVPQTERALNFQRLLTTASGFSGLHAAMVIEAYSREAQV